MSHVIERYFTNTPNVELTDRLCEATLKTVINNAPLALKNPEMTVIEGIDRLSSFFENIGLPVTSKELNIPDDRFEEMASKCVESVPVGTFVKLSKEDVINILKLAK